MSVGMTKDGARDEKLWGSVGERARLKMVLVVVVLEREERVCGGGIAVVAWGGMSREGVLVLGTSTGIDDADCEPKIRDATDAHLVDEDVLELDVAVDEQRLLVEVPEAADDLSEDHAGIVLEEGGSAERLEDVEERAGGTVEGEEVEVGGGVVAGKEGQDVLVREEGPDGGLAEMLFGCDDDLGSDDRTRGRDGLADDAGGAIADDGAEGVASDGLGLLGHGGGCGKGVEELGSRR